jgi:hypothetical protein
LFRLMIRLRTGAGLHQKLKLPGKGGTEGGGVLTLVFAALSLELPDWKAELGTSGAYWGICPDS